VEPLIKHPLPALRPTEGAQRLVQEKRLPPVGAKDGAGRLIALVTPENIRQVMMIEAARPERGSGAPWRSAPRRPAN
jgi:hypothetical protein